MSARCTISVLAVGISRPDSTIVVDSSTSIFAVVEGGHHLVELARRHLAVRDADLHLRHMLVQEGRRVVEVGDARHDIEALAAAVMLAQQRLAHDHRIERRHIGAHRQPVDRRRRDQRQLAHARERQLQRARDRRRGQRQHMHVVAQLLQPLLVVDAEMLLLVDDQQAEIGELDALAEQRVGADDDVDVAARRGPSSPRQGPWR